MISPHLMQLLTTALAEASRLQGQGGAVLADAAAKVDVVAEVPVGTGYAAPGSGWAYFVRAGRPAAMWVCVVVLAINGAILPLARLRGVQIEALDWQGLTVFVAGLVALGHQRSGDKRRGCAS